MPQDELLRAWYPRAERALYAHRFAAKGFRTLHLWLGIPLVLLTAFVGTSVFVALEKETSQEFRFITGGTSVVAALLAALQTFLDFRERSDSHNQAAARYGAVRRKIEQFEALPTTDSEGCMEFFDSVRIELDTLAASFPAVSERYWKKADKEIQKARLIATTSSAA